MLANESFCASLSMTAMGLGSPNTKNKDLFRNKVWQKKVQINSQLNINYSFENFIEGSCNRLARSAGFAVAQKPAGTSFNPLLIYGGVGLGKTHLAHAIGIKAKEVHPEKTVLYVSAEKFTQQFIESIRNNTTNDFSHFYQMIDILIIDEVITLNLDILIEIVFVLFCIFPITYTHI